MAIVFDNSSEAYFASTAGPVVIPHTSAGDHLAVGVISQQVGVSVTYNGVALTQLAQGQTGGSSDTQATLFGLAAPDAGTHDVVITLGAASEGWAGVVSRAGVDQSAPSSGGVGDDVGSGRSHSFDIASATGDLVIGLAGSTSQGIASGAGQATRAVKSPQNNGELNGLTDDEPGAALVSLDYDWSLNRFAVFAGASLKAAAAAEPVELAATLVGEGTIAANVSTSGPALLFADDFTGTDGNPPNPADWDVVIVGGTGANAVEIQSNALELTTQSDNGQSDAGANCREAIGDVLDTRLELDVVLPASSNHFFLSPSLRVSSARDQWYALSLRRVSDGGGMTAQIQKITPGGESQVGSSSIPLSGAVARWNVRFQVMDAGTLKAAIRDFSLGPIPDDDWDIQETDASDPISAAGAAEIVLSEGGGEAKTVTVDNFRVFDLAGVVGVELGATLVGEGTITANVVGPSGPALVFADDFTGADGPLDPAKWDTYGEGTFVADIEGNRLRMDASSGTTVDSSDATAVAKMPVLLADLTVEYTVDFPPAGSAGEFYNTCSTRLEPHTGTPIPDPSGYRLVLRRGGPTQQPSFRLVRNVGGVEDPISSTIQLSNSVPLYRVRYQTIGSTIRAAVRDAALGPIPDDDWDLEVEDTNITQAGTIWFRYSKGDAAGSREIFFDDVQVTDLSGAPVELAATLAGEGDIEAAVAVERRIGAALTGTGELRADAQVAHPLAATLAGAGELDASVTVGSGLSATLTGTGALNAAAAVTRPVSATLTGQGDVQATPRVERALAAVLAGSGAVAADIVVVRQIGATLAGTGDLEADVDITGAVLVGATLAGSGELDAAVQVEHALSAELAGTGTIVADVSASQIREVAATLVGTGALVADVEVHRMLAATLAGVGELDAGVQVVRRFGVTLAGEGMLIATVVGPAVADFVTVRRIQIAPTVGVLRRLLISDVQTGKIDLEPNEP